MIVLSKCLFYRLEVKSVSETYMSYSSHPYSLFGIISFKLINTVKMGLIPHFA